MKSETYNDEVQSSEKDFETLQLDAFVTPGLLLAQEPVRLTAESGINPQQRSATAGPIRGKLGRRERKRRKIVGRSMLCLYFCLRVRAWVASQLVHVRAAVDRD
jgi:hypothetical protein